MQLKNIIILGSGRSGTSMIAGALANSGFYLGEKSNYLGENKANPKGFFEDFEVNTINEDILQLSLPRIPESIRKFFFPSSTIYRFRWFARLPLWLPIKTNLSINERIQKVIKTGPFCYKDPRFSYTIPVWQKFLKKNTKYLVVYRHPYKTAESILRECTESKIIDRIKMNNKIGLEVWKVMYSHILKNYKDSENKNSWMFIHYDQAFDEVKIKSLENFIGAAFEMNFLDKSLSRTKNIKKIESAEINKIYNELNMLSNYLF